MIQQSSTSSRIAIFFIIITIFLHTIGCTPNNTTDVNPPDALFEYTSTRNFPVTVQFINMSASSAPGPSVYLWDFGDGSSLTAPIMNPLHIYTTAGSYSIKLVETQSDGVKDSVIMVLQLNPTGPSGSSSRAAFSFTVINDSFTTTFTNKTINAESYLWEFGDGTTSTSSNNTITKSYTTPGTYRAKLTAKGPGGMDSCSATITF